MGIDNRIVGAAITELRMRAGMTQQQLAAGLNVSHQAVSKWEKGAALPDIQTLLTLTQMFGVTMEQLLSGDIPGNDEPEEPAEEAEEDEPLYGEPVPKADEPSSIEKWIRGAIPDIQKAAGSAYRAVVDFGENIGNQINDAINRSAQKTAKSTDEAAGDVERKREELEVKRQAFEARQNAFEQKRETLEVLRDAHDEDLSEDAEAHLDEMEAELDQEEAQLDEMEDEIDQLEDELEALEEDDEESDDDDDDDDDDDEDSADEAQKTASGASNSLNNLTIEQVIQMAPFMTRAKLDEIAYSLLKENANFNQVMRLAPFLSRDTLNRIAEGLLLSPANKKNIAALAPFLGNDQLYRLLLNNLDCLDWELMKRVAPFLKRSMVDSLMTYLSTGAKPVYESKPEKNASGLTETIQQVACNLGSIAGDLIDYGKRASEPFRQKAAAPASTETPKTAETEKPVEAPKPAEAPKPRQTAKAPSEMRDKVARTALNAGNWDWLSANLDSIGDRSLVLEIAAQAAKQPEDHSELVSRAALLLDSAQQEALFRAVLDANAWDTVIGLKSVADETIADLIISRAAEADESRRAEAYHAIEVFAPLMSRALLEQITEKALAEENWPLINALTEVF